MSASSGLRSLTFADRHESAPAVSSVMARLLDETAELVCMTAPGGQITYVNRAWRRVLGYTAAEMTGRRPIDLVAPEDRLRYLDVARRLVSGEIIEAFEATLLTRDGQRVVCRGRASPEMVADPDVPGGRRCIATYASYRDLTAEREAEAVRARLVATCEATSDLMGIATFDGRLDYLNRAGRRLLGIADAAPLIGLNSADVHPPSTLTRLVREAYPLAAAGGTWEGEGELIGASGELIPVSMVFVAHSGLGDGASGFFSAIMRDQRSQLATKAALAASEARHRELLGTLPVMVYRVEPHPPYTPIYISRTLDTLGYTLDEWLAEPEQWERALHPDDRERVLRDTAASIDDDAPLEYDYRLLAKDGSVRWIHDRGEVVRDAKGRPIAWQGVMLDVTAQAEAEQALERERTFLASVLDSLSENVTVCDATGQLTLINRATRAYHGLPEQGLMTGDRWRRPNDMFLPDGVTPFPAGALPHQRALRTGADLDHVEFVIAPEGLPRRTMVANVRVLRDAHGTVTGSVCAARDMTAQKAIELALRESEARVRGAIDASIDAVFVYRAIRDETGYIGDFEFTDCNVPGAAMFGMTPVDLLGRRLCEAFPTMREDDEVMEAFRRVVETGVAHVHERETRDPRTQARHILMQAVRVGDGLGVTARDITDQKIVEERLRVLALVDELTGVPNRRGFMSLADREWQRARREQRGAVLAYIDLDDFKAINDSYGHAEGDLALQAVADVLRAAFRGADVIGRLGGDEFAVLVVPGGPASRGMPDIASVEAVVRDRIAHHLSASNEDARAGGRSYDIAMCVGTAIVRPPAEGGDAPPESLTALMALADEQLYEEKRARDRRR